MTNPPKAKIYTKKGDSGSTNLVDGTIVRKHNERVEAYGGVDELNSFIGLLLSQISDLYYRTPQLNQALPPIFNKISVDLEKVQNTLFVIGSHLACIRDETRDHLPILDEKPIKNLESLIDQLENELTPLKEFILPGGSLIASHAHICRTRCREAERRVSQIANPNEFDKLSLIFLNRLSDYFFCLARYANQLLNVKDKTWVK